MFSTMPRHVALDLIRDLLKKPDFRKRLREIVEGKNLERNIDTDSHNNTISTNAN
ncbi:hypothetical protein JBO49_02800 [Serratia fonticola]|uniref:hypothetical protein n=1 Tax=Serratia fonticola TaxID=47917 RepID=UPI00192CD852|nr:hypothetical protein [Serratia fonticola]MBL5859541.1 hypothetical protein [Serratia fonticola]